MKLATFISAGAFVLFSGFVLKKEAARQSSSLYGSKWELMKIHISDSVEGVRGAAFIKFNRENKSAGGNGGCNSFGSTISVTGNTIKIKDIIATQMFCEGVQKTEETFFKQLGWVNRFVINGKTLVLYKDKVLLLEFESK